MQSMVEEYQSRGLKVVSSPAAHALNEREGVWHTKSTFLELENKIRLSNQITVFCDVMCDVDFNMANNC